MVYALHIRKHSFMMTIMLMIGLTTALFTVRPASGAEVPDFADLAEKLGPTVVNIYTTQTIVQALAPAQCACIPSHVQLACEASFRS